jgi:hypothetical protein
MGLVCVSTRVCLCVLMIVRHLKLSILNCATQHVLQHTQFLTENKTSNVERRARNFICQMRDNRRKIITDAYRILYAANTHKHAR